ncbi:MAG: hypothetical protein QM737_19435 [Ferruginibacter sp.]
MVFIDFIKKYYPPLQQKELIGFLNDLNVYNNIDDSINNFYNAAKRENKMEVIAHLALTCSELVTIIHGPLHHAKTVYQKSRIAQKMGELAGYLINNTYKLSGLGIYEYSALINQIIRRTSSKYSWDYSIIKKLLATYNIRALVIEEKEKNNTKAFHRSKRINIKWLGSKPLDLFIDDLAKTFKGVKSKKQVYHLFDEMKTDFNVVVPLQTFYPFSICFMNCINTL